MHLSQSITPHRHEPRLHAPLRVISVLLWSAFFAACFGTDHLFTVGTGKIQFTLPDRWTRSPAPGGDAYLFTDEAGRRYSLVVNKQPNSKGIANLKTSYERDFPKGLKDFKLVRSEVTKVNTFEVLLIEHTNTMPGAPIRQFFYVVDLGDPSVFFTFSELEGVGNALHAEYAAVIATVKKLE